MKKFNEEDNEDFWKKSFNFKDPKFGKEKHFDIFFALLGVSLVELKIDLRKILIKASWSQNLQNSSFRPIFHQNFTYKTKNSEKIGSNGQETYLK